MYSLTSVSSSITPSTNLKISACTVKINAVQLGLYNLQLQETLGQL